MNQKLIDRYIEVARALQPKYQNGRFFHVTCIFDKNRLLSIGVNDYRKEHPRRKYGVYSPTKEGSYYRPSLHAEIKALLKLGEEDCSKFVFLNIRLNANGEPALAKPCQNCFGVLKNQVGYKRIYYTSGKDNQIIEVV